MQISVKILGVWLMVHVVIWLLQLFAISVVGAQFSCPANTSVYTCGTPLSATLDIFGETPAFNLLSAPLLALSGIYKILLLLTFDYAILDAGDGFAGGVGIAIRAAGSLASLALIVTAGYQLISGGRGVLGGVLGR